MSSSPSLQVQLVNAQGAPLEGCSQHSVPFENGRIPFQSLRRAACKLLRIPSSDPTAGGGGSGSGDNFVSLKALLDGTFVDISSEKICDTIVSTIDRSDVLRLHARSISHTASIDAVVVCAGVVRSVALSVGELVAKMCESEQRSSSAGAGGTAAVSVLLDAVKVPFVYDELPFSLDVNQVLLFATTSDVTALQIQQSSINSHVDSSKPTSQQHHLPPSPSSPCNTNTMIEQHQRSRSEDTILTPILSAADFVRFFALLSSSSSVSKSAVVIRIERHCPQVVERWNFFKTGARLSSNTNTNTSTTTSSPSSSSPRRSQFAELQDELRHELDCIHNDPRHLVNFAKSFPTLDYVAASYQKLAWCVAVLVGYFRCPAAPIIDRVRITINNPWKWLLSECESEESASIFLKVLVCSRVSFSDMRQIEEVARVLFQEMFDPRQIFANSMVLSALCGWCRALARACLWDRSADELPKPFVVPRPPTPQLISSSSRPASSCSSLAASTTIPTRHTQQQSSSAALAAAAAAGAGGGGSGVLPAIGGGGRSQFSSTTSSLPQEQQQPSSTTTSSPYVTPSQVRKYHPSSGGNGKTARLAPINTGSNTAAARMGTYTGSYVRSPASIFRVSYGLPDDTPWLPDGSTSPKSITTSPNRPSSFSSSPSAFDSSLSGSNTTTSSNKNRSGTTTKTLDELMSEYEDALLLSKTTNYNTNALYNSQQQQQQQQERKPGGGAGAGRQQQQQRLSNSTVEDGRPPRYHHHPSASSPGSVLSGSDQQQHQLRGGHPASRSRSRNARSRNTNRGGSAATLSQQQQQLTVATARAPRSTTTMMLPPLAHDNTDGGGGGGGDSRSQTARRSSDNINKRRSGPTTPATINTDSNVIPFNVRLKQEENESLPQAFAAEDDGVLDRTGGAGGGEIVQMFDDEENYYYDDDDDDGMMYDDEEESFYDEEGEAGAFLYGTENDGSDGQHHPFFSSPADSAGKQRQRQKQHPSVLISDVSDKTTISKRGGGGRDQRGINNNKNRVRKSVTSLVDTTQLSSDQFIAVRFIRLLDSDEKRTELYSTMRVYGKQHHDKQKFLLIELLPETDVQHTDYVFVAPVRISRNSSSNKHHSHNKESILKSVIVEVSVDGAATRSTEIRLDKLANSTGMHSITFSAPASKAQKKPEEASTTTTTTSSPTSAPASQLPSPAQQRTEDAAVAEVLITMDPSSSTAASAAAAAAATTIEGRAFHAEIQVDDLCPKHLAAGCTRDSSCIALVRVMDVDLASADGDQQQESVTRDELAAFFFSASSSNNSSSDNHDDNAKSELFHVVVANNDSGNQICKTLDAAAAQDQGSASSSSKDNSSLLKFEPALYSLIEPFKATTLALELWSASDSSQPVARGTFAFDAVGLNPRHNTMGKSTVTMSLTPSFQSKLFQVNKNNKHLTMSSLSLNLMVCGVTPVETVAPRWTVLSLLSGIDLLRDDCDDDDDDDDDVDGADDTTPKMTDSSLQIQVVQDNAASNISRTPSFLATRHQQPTTTSERTVPSPKLTAGGGGTQKSVPSKRRTLYGLELSRVQYVNDGFNSVHRTFVLPPSADNNNNKNNNNNNNNNHNHNLALAPSSQSAKKVDLRFSVNTRGGGGGGGAGYRCSTTMEGKLSVRNDSKTAECRTVAVPLYPSSSPSAQPSDNTTSLEKTKAEPTSFLQVAIDTATTMTSSGATSAAPPRGIFASPQSMSPAAAGSLPSAAAPGVEDAPLPPMFTLIVFQSWNCDHIPNVKIRVRNGYHRPLAQSTIPLSTFFTPQHQAGRARSRAQNESSFRSVSCGGSLSSMPDGLNITTVSSTSGNTPPSAASQSPSSAAAAAGLLPCFVIPYADIGDQWLCLDVLEDNSNTNSDASENLTLQQQQQQQQEADIFVGRIAVPLQQQQQQSSSQTDGSSSSTSPAYNAVVDHRVKHLHLEVLTPEGAVPDCSLLLSVAHLTVAKELRNAMQERSAAIATRVHDDASDRLQRHYHACRKELPSHIRSVEQLVTAWTELDKKENEGLIKFVETASKVPKLSSSQSSSSVLKRRDGAALPAVDPTFPAKSKSGAEWWCKPRNLLSANALKRACVLPSSATAARSRGFHQHHPLVIRSKSCEDGLGVLSALVLMQEDGCTKHTPNAVISSCFVADTNRLWETFNVMSVFLHTESSVTQVSVDDWIPVTVWRESLVVPLRAWGGSLEYPVLWPAALQKAIAKHFGTYEALPDVDLMTAMELLTGAPSAEITFLSGEPQHNNGASDAETSNNIADHYGSARSLLRLRQQYLQQQQQNALDQLAITAEANASDFFSRLEYAMSSFGAVCCFTCYGPASPLAAAIKAAGLEPGRSYPVVDVRRICPESSPPRYHLHSPQQAEEEAQDVFMICLRDCTNVGRRGSGSGSTVSRWTGRWRRESPHWKREGRVRDACLRHRLPSHAPPPSTLVDDDANDEDEDEDENEKRRRRKRNNDKQTTTSSSPTTTFFYDPSTFWISLREEAFDFFASCSMFFVQPSWHTFRFGGQFDAATGNSNFRVMLNNSHHETNVQIAVTCDDFVVSGGGGGGGINNGSFGVASSSSASVAMGVPSSSSSSPAMSAGSYRGLLVTLLGRDRLGSGAFVPEMRATAHFDYPAMGSDAAVKIEEDRSGSDAFFIRERTVGFKCWLLPHKEYAVSIRSSSGSSSSSDGTTEESNSGSAGGSGEACFSFAMWVENVEGFSSHLIPHIDVGQKDVPSATVHRLFNGKLEVQESTDVIYRG